MTREKYKPLLFTITLRSPYRIEKFLEEVNRSELDGKELNRENIFELYKNLIKVGLYKTTGKNANFGNYDRERIIKKWDEEIYLEDEEAKELLYLNKPTHKEKGFSKGWTSRFYTHYEISKRLGFVKFTSQKDLEISQQKSTEKKYEELRKSSIPFQLTETGKKFIDPKTNPSVKQALYANGLMRVHRNGYIIIEKNRNRPVPLLLRALKEITKKDNKGISKFELLIWGYWKNNDPQQLAEAILDFRAKYGSQPSKENIIDYCVNFVQGGDIKRAPGSLTSDYVDNYFRYLHFTGLFTYRGGGRYITLNTGMMSAIDYIIENHSDYIEFSNELDYLDFLSSTDENLLNLYSDVAPNEKLTKSAFLQKWLDEFGIEAVKKEIEIIVNPKGKSQNEILKNIIDPLRLEFLASLYLFHKFENCEVKPSYKIDDEGLPTGFASGIGDIEVICNTDVTLYEVTLQTGYNNQAMNEIVPIDSHLSDLAKKYPSAKAVMLAKNIHERLPDAAELKALQSGNKVIELKTIKDFFI
tara:strand:+ start:86 stop:1666 length:1581 start_codon:yes stop_codon:yes gene_type:complete